MHIGINGGYFPAICRVCLKVWLWFCFIFRLVSVVVWRFLEIDMNFMIIRRFLMYFADFRANFCVFLIILFYWLIWVLKKRLLLEQFYDNNWLQFCGYESFFCWEIWEKNCEIGTNFRNFLQFFIVFSVFS